MSQQSTASPYPGLRPYREDEKDNFFGRDADREILIDKILSNRLTLLFAATGVGKSSLLQAAVMPQLKDPLGENLTVIYHNDWVIDPIDSLKQSIIGDINNSIKNQTIPTDLLEKKQQTLPQLLEFCSLFTRHPLIIILDQFEEFFRYQKQGEQFHEFINQITSLIINSKLPLSLVFSMREDFALELDAFKPKLPTLLFENYYRIDKLGEQAAKDAIQIPAQRAGFSYQPKLFKQLLNDLLSRDLDRAPSTLSQENSKTAEPPYIQIVCGQLWELEKDNPDKTLHLKTYQNKGGAKGLLKNYVNHELNHFSTAEKNIASRAFDHLVSRRGTKMPHTVEDLAQLIHQDEQALKKVFEKLTEKRILRSQKRAETIWYELYHDMFSPVIEDWNTIWKGKMRKRRFAIIASTTAIGLFALYAGFDYYSNKTNYQLLSKNKPNDYLDVYQGKLGSNDLFHQKHYLMETRYQRKDLEPDKCVKHCGVFNHTDLNTELIVNLPLLERITAYAEDGQFNKAIDLFNKTLKNNNRKNTIMAIKHFTKIKINANLPRLAHLIEYSKSSSIRKAIRLNMPIVATKTLFKNQEITLEFSLKNNDLIFYLAEHNDWFNKITNNQTMVFTEDIKIRAYTNDDQKYLNLANITGLSSISFLLNKLADENKDVRYSAVDALGNLKNSQAIQPLIKALADEDSSVRSSAVKALGYLKSPQAIQPLIQVLADEDWPVSNYAAEALGKLKSPQVIQPLIKVLADEDENVGVRRSAAEVLGNLKSPQAIQPLIQALADEDKDVRGSAAYALGKLKSPLAIQPLIQALADEDKGVRRSAAYALGKLKNPQAIQPLIQALADENEDIRSSAADTLGKLKSPQATQPLIQALADENSDVRRSAADALRYLTSPQALQPLIKALADEDKDVRYSAAKALGKLKSPQAIQPLIQALADEDKYVRSFAADALGNLKSPQVIQPLIQALADENESVRGSAAKALGKLKSPQAIQLLIQALADESEYVRGSAAKALGNLKSPQAIQLLIQALDDEESYVRGSAAIALGKLKNPQAIQPLIKVLAEENRMEGYKDIHISAAYALGNLKSPLALEALSQSLFYTERLGNQSSVFRNALAKIVEKNQSNLLKIWINKIITLYPIEEETDEPNEEEKEEEKEEKAYKKALKDKSPQQLNQQINNPKAILAERLDALDRLIEINPDLAKQTLLILLKNQANEAIFATRLYPALAEVKAVEALEIIQQRLESLSEQWQNWRNKRDELSKIDTAAMTEQQKADLEDQQKQLQKDKPQPIVPAFVYAYSIAQLNPDKGIELLQHNLAEARRGAWEGLAKIADIALLKKLDKIRESNKENPILHHAAYRAIDLSLIVIRNKVKKQDMQALDAYLKQLENAGRLHSNPDLSKNDPVALRIEWTRDRIKEGLQSIKRVECRAENWFKTKWPEKGCP